MQTISTTELRTRSKDLVKVLNEGKRVDLIHRSKVVGQINPKGQSQKVFDAVRFLKIINKLNLPILTDEEIDKRYRKAMEKKHGKSIPRHK